MKKIVLAFIMFVLAMIIGSMKLIGIIIAVLIIGVLVFLLKKNKIKDIHKRKVIVGICFASFAVLIGIGGINGERLNSERNVKKLANAKLFVEQAELLKDENLARAVELYDKANSELYYIDSLESSDLKTKVSLTFENLKVQLGELNEPLALELLNKGDLAIEKNNIEKGKSFYQQASEIKYSKSSELAGNKYNKIIRKEKEQKLIDARKMLSEGKRIEAKSLLREIEGGYGDTEKSAKAMLADIIAKEQHEVSLTKANIETSADKNNYKKFTQKIKNKIPIKLLPFQQKEFPTHILQKSSFTAYGREQNIMLYDYNKDGVFDKISFILIFDSNNEKSMITALGFPSIVLETITGKKTNLSKFLTNNVSKAVRESVKTTLSNIPISYYIMPAKNGGVAMLEFIISKNAK